MLNSESLSNIIKHLKDKDVEIEIRFGTYNDNKYSNGVSYVEYARLLDYFTGQYTKLNIPIYYETYTIKIYDKYRIYNDKYTFKKDKIYDYYSLDYPIRLSIAYEVKVNGIGGRYKFTRIIHRTSFMMDTMRLDISRVVVGDDIYYEVELEIISGIEYINERLSSIYMIMLGTREIYTLKEVPEYIEMPSLKILSVDNIDNIIPGSMCRLPDGIRCLLYVYYNGIWLINNNSRNLVVRLIMKDLIGYVLDGFLVDNNLYLAMDCIRAPILGQYGYSSQPLNLTHRKRMDYVQTVTDNIKSNNFSVYSLKFRYYPTSSQLFSNARTFINEEEYTYFKSIGLIFVPDNSNVKLYWTHKPKVSKRDKDGEIYEYQWKGDLVKVKRAYDVTSEVEYNIILNQYMKGKLGNKDVLYGKTMEFFNYNIVKTWKMIIDKFKPRFVLNLTGIVLNISGLVIDNEILRKAYDMVMVGNDGIDKALNYSSIVAYIKYDRLRVIHKFSGNIGFGLDIDSYEVGGIKLKLNDDVLMVGDNKIKLVDMDSIVKMGYRVTSYGFDTDTLMLTNAESFIASLYHYGWIEEETNELYQDEDGLVYKLAKL